MILCGRLSSRDRHAEMITSRTGSSNCAPRRYRIHETPEPPLAPGRERRTRAPGDRSLARVLEHAAALATLEGLDGVSIARIAAATGMPKSSVYVLFGSKEELQLATIDAARANFIRHVVTPAITTTPPGRQRLQQLCDGYLDYVEQRIFPGGC